MKKTIVLALSLCLLQSIATIAQEAQSLAGGQKNYSIKIVTPDEPGTKVYLAHYYGKGLYLTDSALVSNGTVKFEGHDPNFVGGSYMLLSADKHSNLEVLLNREDDIKFRASVSKLPEGVKMSNSQENERFQEYQQHAREYGEAEKNLAGMLEGARSKSDTQAIRDKSARISKDFLAYKRQLISENPKTLLASILRAMEKPVVPEGDHFLPDGVTKDTAFAYRYYKAHFWDGFNFQDDRLIYTPLYDALLEEYVTKLVLPWPDSIKYECDMLLKKAAGTRDVFHYTLWYLTRYVENSKVMGVSDVFVHLVENYYMKGAAFWLSSDELQKYLDRAAKMAPNVNGNIAPALKLPNVMTGKIEDLKDLKAAYTVVVFYSPNCGHCQHELPLLDSAYEASLKSKGVKIFTVATEGDEKAVSDFLVKNKLDKKWINTWDPDHTSSYHSTYDVYMTPTIYLLDEKKIILGKKLDHSSLGALINIVQKKSKKN